MLALPSLTQPAVYRLRLAGRAPADWSDYLAELQVAVEPAAGGQVTVLTGRVADQAALFGLLCNIRDRGLVLVSVEYLPDAPGG